MFIFYFYKMILYLLIVLMSSSVWAKSNINASLGQRIIGGSPASAGQFPFMAAIYKSTNDGAFFCGGTLMNDQWILTSGYCVDSATIFSMFLGAHNLNENNPNSLQVATDSYIAHPDFDPLALANDIGLIKLRLPITLTTYVRPADYLPNYELTPNTAGIMAMGWGQTDDETSGIVDELHYVYLTPISNDDCKLTFGNQIVDTMVCAVGSYNQGFCKGDTGTPLVRYSFHITTIVGIASFISGNGCETPEPSGYTRTYEYVEWIRNVSNIE